MLIKIKISQTFETCEIKWNKLVRKIHPINFKILKDSIKVFSPLLIYTLTNTTLKRILKIEEYF